MFRKVKKYLKFVVCCALIMSLVAPSYAALSASDGSAFVTKAEFDSALADFNARLTTFEAGINSKIDSQVTSYLDRNGIWNSKEQDCKGFSWRLGEVGEHTKYMQSATPQTSWQIADSYIGAIPLCKITKSGLLVATVIDSGDGLSASVDFRRNKIVKNDGSNIDNQDVPCFVNIWLFAYRFVQLPAPNSSDYSYGTLQTSWNESTSMTKGFKQNDGSFVSTDNIVQEYVNILPYRDYCSVRGAGSGQWQCINPCIPTAGGCNFTTLFFVEKDTYLGFACHSFWQIQTSGKPAAYRMFVDSAPLTTLRSIDVY